MHISINLTTSDKEIISEQSRIISMMSEVKIAVTYDDDDSRTVIILGDSKKEKRQNLLRLLGLENEEENETKYFSSSEEELLIKERVRLHEEYEGNIDGEEVED